MLLRKNMNINLLFFFVKFFNKIKNKRILIPIVLNSHFKLLKITSAKIILISIRYRTENQSLFFYIYPRSENEIKKGKINYHDC